MAAQEQVQKPTSEKVDAAEAQRMAEADAEVQAAQETPGADLSVTDELLDEIDALLEDVTVATEYRQRGGQ